MGARAFIRESSFAQKKKQEILDQMQWEGRTYNVSTNADVSVSKIKANGAFAINFIFKNDVEQLIDPENIERIETCVLSDRLYFRANENGYKQTKRGGRAYMKCKSSKKIEEFVGDYDLEYDPILDFYYIQKQASERLEL